jgi:hypothetical protein
LRRVSRRVGLLAVGCRAWGERWLPGLGGERWLFGPDWAARGDC